MKKERGEKKQSPRAEDYLEAIYHLIHEKGYASTMGISDRLKVKAPSVSVMIGKLASKRYLEYEPYRGMNLTGQGEKLALSVINRHAVISEFLSMIGVEDEIAYEDTEGIEHHVHSTTIYRIQRLVDFLKKNKPGFVKSTRDLLETR